MTFRVILAQAKIHLDAECALEDKEILLRLIGTQQRMIIYAGS